MTHVCAQPGTLILTPTVGLQGEMAQGSCNIDINFPELFLDGGHANLSLFLTLTVTPTLTVTLTPTPTQTLTLP